MVVHDATGDFGCEVIAFYGPYKGAHAEGFAAEVQPSGWMAIVLNAALEAVRDPTPDKLREAEIAVLNVLDGCSPHGGAGGGEIYITYEHLEALKPRGGSRP